VLPQSVSGVSPQYHPTAEMLKARSNKNRKSGFVNSHPMHTHHRRSGSHGSGNFNYLQQGSNNTISAGATNSPRISPLRDRRKSSQSTPRQSRLLSPAAAAESDLIHDYSTDDETSLSVSHRTVSSRRQHSVIGHNNSPLRSSSRHSSLRNSITLRRGGGARKSIHDSASSTSTSTDSSDDECRIVPDCGHDDDDDYLERLDRRVTEVINRSQQQQQSTFRHDRADVTPVHATTRHGGDYNRRSQRAKHHSAKTPGSSSDACNSTNLTEEPTVNNNNNSSVAGGQEGSNGGSQSASVACGNLPGLAGLIRFEEDEEGNAEADDTQESSQEDFVGGISVGWSDDEVEHGRGGGGQMIKRRSLSRRPIRGSMGQASLSRVSVQPPTRQGSGRSGTATGAGAAVQKPATTTSDEYPCSSSQRSTLDKTTHKIQITSTDSSDDDDVTTEVASSMTPRQSVTTNV